MKTIGIFKISFIVLALAFVFASCQKAAEIVENVETPIIELAENNSDIEESHDPNYFQGTKRFCEFLNYWEYSVTIDDDYIFIQKHPGSDNDNFSDKSIPQSIINGRIINGKIVIEVPEDCDYCGPDYAETAFKYEDGVFYELHSENDYNNYNECK